MNPAERALLEAFLYYLLDIGCKFPNITPAILVEQLKVWLDEWIKLQPNNPEQPPP